MENNISVLVNGTISTGFVNINDMFDVCVREDTDIVHSHGFGDRCNPFHFAIPVTLLQIFLFLVVSKLLYFILRPLKTPNFVCSLLGGILLGPSCLGRYRKLQSVIFPPVQYEFLMFISWIAAAYFVFIVSLKMEAVENLKNARRTWRIGVFPMLTSILVMVFLTFILFPLPSDSIVDDMTIPLRMLISITISVNTFPVVSENLLELNLITSELGQIAMSATMVSEVVHWMFISITTIVRSQHTMAFAFSYIVYICLCLVIVRPVTGMISRMTPPGKPVKEGYVLLIQLGVLIMGLLSDFFGLSFIQGPFLVGIVMPHGPPLATTLAERTEVILSHFLMPLYFCYIGVSIDPCSIHNWPKALKILLIIFVGVVIKTIACILISLMYNVRLKHGLTLGLMMNFKGFIDLMIFNRSRVAKVMDDEVFATLVFAVMLDAAITSPLVRILYKPHARLETIIGLQQKEVRTIQNTPRNIDFCLICCVHEEGDVRGMMALVEAMNPPHQAYPICLFAIHLVELRGQITPALQRVNIHKRPLPRSVSSSSWTTSFDHSSTTYIMRAFDNYFQNPRHGGSDVNVVPCVNIAPYKNMHESICNLAHDNSIPLIVLPFHQNDHYHVSIVNAIQDLNANFQSHTPCTVGILVDRHARLGVTLHNASFHVGIFFIGGADDREALALGMRMSERVNTSIELFRFVMEDIDEGSNRSNVLEEEIFETHKEQKEKEKHALLAEEEEEKTMDEKLIEEFMTKKFGNYGQVVYHEISVIGWEEVMESIRIIEKGNFDLVMVGRKHNKEFIGFSDEESMSYLIDNATLGLFGDILASKEFCNGSVPVFVLQSGTNRDKFKPS